MAGVRGTRVQNAGKLLVASTPGVCDRSENLASLWYVQISIDELRTCAMQSTRGLRPLGLAAGSRTARASSPLPGKCTRHRLASPGTCRRATGRRDGGNIAGSRHPERATTGSGRKRDSAHGAPSTTPMTRRWGRWPSLAVVSGTGSRRAGILDAPMLPRPSICLHIPKTGSTWADWFFNAADWLELRRSFHVRRLAIPYRTSLELVRRIKRHGPAFGNLNCRTGDHHTGYAGLPEGLRHLPKIAVLRDLEGWYASFHLYYTGVMKRTLLSEAVRMLVHGEDRPVRAEARAVLHANADAFRERYVREDAAARSGGPVSVGFLLWFQRAVRLPFLMKSGFGLDAVPAGPGFLTCRAISMLFEDPAQVLSMEARQFEAYFAGGAWLRDLRCDYLLDNAGMSDQLAGVMVDRLGYDADIVAYLKTYGGRRNSAPASGRARVLRALRADEGFAAVRETERIYETRLLPLAGTWFPSRDTADRSVRAGVSLRHG